MQAASATRLQGLELEEVARQVGDLPSLPVSATEALRLMEDPEVTIEALQRVLGRDQGLAAQILKIANSAMYCLQRQVSTLSHALAILGLDALRSIVVAASIRNVFYSGRRSQRSLPLHLLWQHAWGAAVMAQSIARRARYRNTDEAFTCGLVHDLGKLVMLKNHAPAYAEIVRAVDRGEGGFSSIEQQVFGFTHAQVGALLVLKWCFPVQLVEGILHHHDMAPTPEYAALTAVASLANRYMVLTGIGFEKDPSLVLEDEPGARALGLQAAELDELLAEAREIGSHLPEQVSA
jgi:HD-like signal output (HDOD) protein